MKSKPQKSIPFSNVDVVRFIGVSLGGGKSNSACLAALDFYPQHEKLFLVKLHDQISSEDQTSADFKIIELIDSYKNSSTLNRELFIQSVAFDVPFELPVCVTCSLICPSYEHCKEPHIQWMWTQTQKKISEKKNKKLFTPYTQKSLELYLEQELEEIFHRNDALGSNLGPLTMRAHFLSKRIQYPKIEIYPQLSMWRLGLDLKILKRHLKSHRASVGGDDSRRALLNEITEKRLAFLYQQDQKMMIESTHAFEAFLCAFTGFLKYKGLTEARPQGFPENETWIEFPKLKLDLIKLLGKD